MGTLGLTRALPAPGWLQAVILAVAEICMFVAGAAAGFAAAFAISMANPLNFLERQCKKDLVTGLIFH